MPAALEPHASNFPPTASLRGHPDHGPSLPEIAVQVVVVDGYDRQVRGGQIEPVEDAFSRDWSALKLPWQVDAEGRVRVVLRASHVQGALLRYISVDLVSPAQAVPTGIVSPVYLKFRAHPPGMLTIAVAGERGEPVPDCDVTCSPAPLDAGKLKTDSQGQVTFRSSVGMVWIRVWSPDGRSAFCLKPVAPGAEQTLRVRLADAEAVRVRVRSEDSRLPPGSEVLLRWRARLPGVPVPLLVNGDWTEVHVPGGARGDVVVAMPDRPELTLSSRSVRREGRDLTVEIPPLRSVRVAVTTADGDPACGMAYSLVPTLGTGDGMESQSIGVRLDERGESTGLDLLPGAYRLVTGEFDERLRAEAFVSEVEVGREPTQLIRVADARAHTVAGHVECGAGVQVPGGLRAIADPDVDDALWQSERVFLAAADVQSSGAFQLTVRRPVGTAVRLYAAARDRANGPTVLARVGDGSVQLRIGSPRRRVKVSARVRGAMTLGWLRLTPSDGSSAREGTQPIDPVTGDAIFFDLQPCRYRAELISDFDSRGQRSSLAPVDVGPSSEALVVEFD